MFRVNVPFGFPYCDFTGRENDGTGLYYYRARHHDPSRSRFLSEDPLRTANARCLRRLVGGGA